ncbi:MAG: hypothetical protein Cons2KO_30480 [Congregibacter sp.]
MCEDDSVDDFDKIMRTNISVSFYGLLGLLNSLGILRRGGRALDVACGPGHFTNLVAEHGNFSNVTGVDLSEQMLSRARLNANQRGLSERVTFRAGDAVTLAGFQDNSVDLAICTNAAHHLPDTRALEGMISSLDRVTGPDGVVVIMDLTRLKHRFAIEAYGRVFGKEYIDYEMPALYEDFMNSLAAAWSPRELQLALPQKPSKNWKHFCLSPLPVNQFVLGLPTGMEASVQWEQLSRFASNVDSKYSSDMRQYLKMLQRTACREFTR